ncbi:hypothetical protein DXG03_005047 [Asterophora parasitica]|uniref:Piwi domain-containing protein n=1 Tax=Asterophora parasitica TaxID=117018 RepID=A0A9P7KEH0_9AGAR|nr:hypothetical protein DXG03_005047 [Asterophora parasitica]
MRWNRPEGNKGFVYHYDAILPLWDTGTRDFKLGNKKGSELVMRLQTTVRPDLFNPLGAYDGKKNLFSFQKYSVASEEICVEHLRLSDVRDLYKFKPHDPKIGLLRLFLRGVKVEVDLPSHFGKRPKTIKDVLENVGAIMFNKGAESVSIADHFATAHGRTIRQGSIGVRLGSDGIFPIAVLKTIQQLFKNRASPDVVREALEFSPPNPHRRLKAITDGWQELKYTSSPFLIGAGISVQPEPLHVEGRMLPSPKIRFGDRNERPGQWDVMRKKFFKPVRLGSWIVVDFANCERSVLNRFIDDLLKAMRERGMEASEPLAVERRPGNADVEDVLRRVGGEARARLILVILPESAAEVYRRTKRFGDIDQGVVTQCVKWSRKLAVDASQGRANQYHNNLLLK